MMTASPLFQLTGVVIGCLSLSCRARLCVNNRYPKLCRYVQSTTLKFIKISHDQYIIELGYKPDDFIKVTATRSRISKGQANLLLGINDEDSANLSYLSQKKTMKRKGGRLTVKGSPLPSLLVGSCSSNISYRVEIFLSVSAIYKEPFRFPKNILIRHLDIR